MKRKRYDTTVQFSLPDNFYLEADVIDFTPSRPAPACSNHDSPAFSDPGDDAEAGEIVMYLVHDGEKWDHKKQKKVRFKNRIKLGEEVQDELEPEAFIEIIENAEEKYLDYYFTDEER